MNSDNQYIQGKNDLFAVMIIFKLLLPDLTFKTFVKNLNHELDNLRKNLIVLNEKNVLDAMGFPNNWREKLLQK